MNKTAHIALVIVINALRFALALVFVFSGFVKAVDPMGTVIKLTDYAEAFGMTVSPALLYVGMSTAHFSSAILSLYVIVVTAIILFLLLI